jgi:hypothetical protein
LGSEKFTQGSGKLKHAKASSLFWVLRNSKHVEAKDLFWVLGNSFRVLGIIPAPKKGFWEIQNNSQNPKNPEPKKWHP